MIWPVHGDQGSDQRIGIVLAHPFARYRNPKAVANDVYLVRAGEGDDGAHERAQQRDRGSSRMRNSRAPRLVLQQVALISLIAERPYFIEMEAIVHKKLSKVVDVAKRVAGCRERSGVVAVQEDDWNVSGRAVSGPEPDHRHAQVGVDDDRK